MSFKDSKKFLSLLGKCQARIYAYILYQVPNRNDAEDILQDTIVVMLDKFSEFEEGTNFLAWGLQIARYKIMAYRDKRKNSKLIFDDDILNIMEQEKEIQSAIAKEEFDRLSECIKKLPDKYKKYLQYRYEDSLSYKAIGDKVSISGQAVHKTMSRIHLALMNCVRLGVVSD